MTTFGAIAPPPLESEGSSFRRSLTERGVIVMKENRPIAWVTSSYGSRLEISGQILVVVKGTSRTVTLGVKLEQPETETSIGSAAFLDYDELDEFQGALAFIQTAAGQMAAQARDYTEVTYSTRDNVTVGFYQDGAKQQAFVRLGAGSSPVFFAIRSLPEINDGVTRAKDHVSNRRGAWEVNP
jgi:hypothetical protein